MLDVLTERSCLLIVPVCAFIAWGLRPFPENWLLLNILLRHSSIVLPDFLQYLHSFPATTVRDAELAISLQVAAVWSILLQT